MLITRAKIGRKSWTQNQYISHRISSAITARKWRGRHISKVINTLQTLICAAYVFLTYIFPFLSAVKVQNTANKQHVVHCKSLLQQARLFWKLLWTIVQELDGKIQKSLVSQFVPAWSARLYFSVYFQLIIRHFKVLPHSYLTIGTSIFG